MNIQIFIDEIQNIINENNSLKLQLEKQNIHIEKLEDELKKEVEKDDFEKKNIQNKYDELNAKHEKLSKEVENIQEYIDDNYYGIEIVNSEYLQSLEKVLKIYKENYGAEIEETYMKEYNEHKNSNWWKTIFELANIDDK
jgi:arginine deiminase